MNRWMRVLVTGVLLFVGCGPLYYTVHILDPYLRANTPADAPGFGSDFYPRWVGLQAIFRHQNPYSQTTTSAIQAGYYGHALGPSEKRDPQSFAYPAYVAIVLAPLASMKFASARTWFAVLLVLAAALSTLLWLSLEQWPRIGSLSFGLATALIFGSWPVAQGIYAQQMSLLVAFFLACAFYAVSRHWLRVAGLLLALSTIKPQLSWLSVVWLVAWSLYGSRRRLLWWFAGATALLGIGSEFLVPGWPVAWLATLHDYMRYTGSRLNLQILLGNAAGSLITAVLVVAGGIVLWRGRSAEAGSAQFRFVVAFLLALTLVALPTWSWASYNQVLLVPAALYLGQRWHHGGFARLGVRLSYGAALLALGWSHLATLGLMLAHLAGFAIRGEAQLRLPTYNYFLVAPLTLQCVYLLRPEELPRPARIAAADN